MRCLFLLALFLPLTSHAIASSICERKNFSSSGLLRSAIVCAPSSRATPTSTAPLVLAFHPRTSPASLAGLDPAKTAAELFRDNKKLSVYWPEAVIVYFEGLQGNASSGDECGTSYSWQMNPGSRTVSSSDVGPGGSCVPLHAPMVDRDVQFVSRFINTQIMPYYTINTRQIYATGESAGSRFSGVLWNITSQQPGGSIFAALAFSSVMPGGMTGGDPDSQVYLQNLASTATPRPIFMSISSVDGERYSDHQLPSLAQVRNLLGISYTYPPAGIVSEYGLLGTELMIYNHGYGHSWPMGSTGSASYANQTDMVVQFLKRHKRK